MKGILFTELNFGLSVFSHKTQTRRIPEPLAEINKAPHQWSAEPYTEKDKAGNISYVFLDETHNTGHRVIKPRFQVDEIVYMQEPTNITPKSSTALIYEDAVLKIKPGTNEEVYVLYKYLNPNNPAIPNYVKWANKMYMNKAYARYHIKITGVKLERLETIKDGDCYSEGVVKCKNGYGFLKGDFSGVIFYGDTPKAAYFKMWEEINGKGSVEKNPWVFAYDYVLHDSLEELQKIDCILLFQYPYLYSEIETNTITLSYDCMCGLDEATFTYKRLHPRWKDIADALLDHAVKFKLDGYFLIKHAVFSYGFSGDLKAHLPVPVQEYAELIWSKRKIPSA